MKSWNWSNITLTGFCLVIAIGMFIWGINIWKKGTAPKKKHTMTAADTRVVLSESNQETVRSDTSANSSCPPVQNEDISAGTPSLAYGLICFLLIIPAVSFVQFIFYRVFHLDFNMPDNLSNVLDILAYLGTICIGLIVALLLWIAITIRRCISSIFSCASSLHAFESADVPPKNIFIKREIPTSNIANITIGITIIDASVLFVMVFRNEFKKSSSIKSA